MAIVPARAAFERKGAVHELDMVFIENASELIALAPTRPDARQLSRCMDFPRPPYAWRYQIEDLKTRYRLIVPDLRVGALSVALYAVAIPITSTTGTDRHRVVNLIDTYPDEEVDA